MKINYNYLNNIDTFIELLTDIVFFKNLNGEYQHFNTAFLKFNKMSREEVLGKTVFDFYSLENAVKFDNDDKKILADNKSRSYDEVFKRDDQDDIYFHTSKQIVYDENNNQIGLFCTARDITSKKQYELIYKDSEFILEYIAIHDDLQKVLTKIVNLAEKRDLNSKCSILLLDKEKKHLLNGAAPSLPDFYNKAVDGVEIGEKVGSCGSAAFSQKRVIVENIDTHENWQPYLELTKKADLHSCWSQPIFSSKDEILGTFAIYHNQPKKPTDFELKLIMTYAHLASVAIEKELNEKEIKQREYQLSQLFNNALVGLMYITGDRVLISANERLAEIFGYDDPEEMVGISMRQIHLSEKRFREFGKKNFEALRDKEIFNVEYQLKKKDGTATWCELSGKALDHNLPADLSKGVLWTISDINIRKKLEEKVKERTKEIEAKNLQLKTLASTDHLTGLYNRSQLDKTLEEKFKYCRRYNSTVGVIMIDIDFFKQVNDQYGHQVGDTILREFADLLTCCSRETDIIGRWGGEEFLIVVNNIDKENLIKLAEKLRVRVETHTFPFLKHKTASFGTALYHPDDEINELVARADKALYNAKNNGRNRVEFLQRQEMAKAFDLEERSEASNNAPIDNKDVNVYCHGPRSY